MLSLKPDATNSDMFGNSIIGTEEIAWVEGIRRTASKFTSTNGPSTATCGLFYLLANRAIASLEPQKGKTAFRKRVVLATVRAITGLEIESMGRQMIHQYVSLLIDHIKEENGQKFFYKIAQLTEANPSSRASKLFSW